MKHPVDESGANEAPVGRKPVTIALLMVAVIVVFYLLREHWGHVAGLWPYLLLLACPHDAPAHAPRPSPRLPASGAPGRRPAAGRHPCRTLISHERAGPLPSAHTGARSARRLPYERAGPLQSAHPGAPCAEGIPVCRAGGAGWMVRSRWLMTRMLPDVGAQLAAAQA